MKGGGLKPKTKAQFSTRGLEQDPRGVAIYYVRQIEPGKYEIEDIVISSKFKVLDKAGEVIDIKSLKSTVPDPEQIIKMLRCADLVMKDGVQRVVHYTSTAEGSAQNRVSLIRKTDHERLVFLIRRDRRNEPGNFLKCKR